MKQILSVVLLASLVVVLAACGGAADAQNPVYHIAQKSIEFIQPEIYYAKAVFFSFIIAIFAMSFNFLLLLNCTTKVSEIFDMAKSLAINCYPGTYK